jgi:hypothetical protein
MLMMSLKHSPTQPSARQKKLKGVTVIKRMKTDQRDKKRRDKKKKRG